MNRLINPYRNTLYKNMRIGLLGGSFNPAHKGHLHISRAAYKRLGLDQVWWMVSYKNPLKSAVLLKDYNVRLQSALDVSAAAPFIRISDVEHELGLSYTSALLDVLKERFPQTYFCWLGGDDLLKEIHRWKNWHTLFARTRFAFVLRLPVPEITVRSHAFTAYRQHLLTDARLIWCLDTPVWTLLNAPRDETSSTSIRRGLGF